MLPSRSDVWKRLGLGLNSGVNFDEGRVGVLCRRKNFPMARPVRVGCGFDRDDAGDVSKREGMRMAEISMPKRLATSWFLM